MLNLTQRNKKESSHTPERAGPCRGSAPFFSKARFARHPKTKGAFRPRGEDRGEDPGGEDRGEGSGGEERAIYKKAAALFLRQPFDIWVIDYIESGIRFDSLLGSRRD